MLSPSWDSAPRYQKLEINLFAWLLPIGPRPFTAFPAAPISKAVPARAAPLTATATQSAPRPFRPASPPARASTARWSNSLALPSARRPAWRTMWVWPVSRSGRPTSTSSGACVVGGGKAAQRGSVLSPFSPLVQRTFWLFPFSFPDSDPRWGRGQETPGEDPTINADYAEDFVSNFQHDGASETYMKASSCCKHYAGCRLKSLLACLHTAFCTHWPRSLRRDTPPALLKICVSHLHQTPNSLLAPVDSLEKWGGVDRHHFNAVITEQDLSDTYFPAFISCANRGNASGLMCSCRWFT